MEADCGGMDDGDVVDALRAGNENAFRQLVAAHHPAMVRLAACYVPSRAVAEEVAQETWLAVIKGLDRFEGRASLKTWIFSILMNQARNRGIRERRSVPFSSFTQDEPEEELEPERFRPTTDRWPGHWADPPRPWSDIPFERVEGAQLRSLVLDAIRALPPNQRDVIALRDVEGWSAQEVCAALGIGDANQRVMLHRARRRVRAVLDRYFRELVTA